MVNERYLEYLALDSILQGYMEAHCLNDFARVEEVYIPWGSKVRIDLNKLKRRVRELQLEFLAPYIKDNTEKSD